MSARAVVAGIDGRAAPFPVYVTAGDALPFLTTFLEDSPNHDQITQELEMHTITAWLRALL